LEKIAQENRQQTAWSLGFRGGHTCMHAVGAKMVGKGQIEIQTRDLSLERTRPHHQATQLFFFKET